MTDTFVIDFCWVFGVFFIRLLMFFIAAIVITFLFFNEFRLISTVVYSMKQACHISW